MPHPLRNRLLLFGSQIQYLLKALFGTKQGFVVDSHGENHLTAVAGPVPTTGKVGSAGQFVAASSQSLTVPDIATLSMGDIDFTVGAWVYLDSKPTTATILSKTATGSVANTEYALEYTGGGTDRFRFRASNGASQTVVSANTLGSPSTSTWYFVVGWHDSVANTVNIQVNAGTTDSAAHTVGSQDTTNSTAIGGYATAYMDGRIDQAFVSKRVLTAQERTDLYNAGAGLAYSALTTAHKVSLVSWWEFEPLPASLPVDVGGPLVLTDTESKMSQSSGKLNFVPKTVNTDGDPGMWGPLLTRTCGRAVLATVVPVASSTRFRVGWDLDQAGAVRYAYRFNTDTSINWDNNGTLVALGSYVAATSYELAIVQRTTGLSFLIRGGIFTAWTLLWVDNTLTGSHYPAFSNFSASGTLDNLRVLDLGRYDSRFATDYALATNRLVSPAAGATTTSTPEAVIEFTATTIPSASVMEVLIRQQDASNYWEIRIDSSGNLYLTECVATVRTQRAAAGGTASGHRVVLTMEGTTIKGYSNNTLRWTYSSATNFQTATGVKVSLLGTSGVISELVCWPRTLSLPGGV